MKFFSAKKYSGGEVLKEIFDYLRTEYNRSIRELSIGLTKLNFLDNFDGFEWTGIIGNGATVSIENKLGQIPSHRIILRSKPITTGGGTIIIDDSDTPWTGEVLYLRNSGTIRAEITAFFIR